MISPLVAFDARLSDSLVRWKAYKEGDNIIARFTFDEWHKIAADIDSEKELYELLTLYPHKIQGFVLYENSTYEAVGVVYLLKEKGKSKAVSYHGGGWGKSIKLSLLYYRGCILLIEYLLRLGYRVRTYCSVDNNRAYRFTHSLGFVLYRISENRKYRLRASKIYKKISFPLQRKV